MFIKFILYYIMHFIICSTVLNDKHINQMRDESDYD